MDADILVYHSHKFRYKCLLNHLKAVLLPKTITFNIGYCIFGDPVKQIKIICLNRFMGSPLFRLHPKMSLPEQLSLEQIT